MKYIKIFLSSSISELHLERLKLSDFVRALNDTYVRRGIYFELVICENLSTALHRERKQQEYNDAIRESRLFYVIFGDKIGRFTVEEFEVALEQFRNTGTPRIFTYFMQPKDGGTHTQAVLDFMKRLEEELGHYYNVFSNIDAVKLNLLLELTCDETIGGSVALEDGYACLNGKAVLSMRQIPIYEKNDALQQIIQAREACEQEYGELVEMLELKPDSALVKKMLEDNRRTRNELMEQQHTMERELLHFCSGISGKRCLGQRINWRERKAIELVDRGDYEGAKILLRDEQWEAEVEHADFIAEHMTDEIAQYIAGKRTLISIIHATGINPETEQEIIDCYERIVELAQKHNVEMSVLYDYASFLMHHNGHARAIDLARRLDHYYAFAQESGEAAAANQYLLACMLYKTNDAVGAEAFHRQALAIREGLYDEVRPSAMANYGVSCNQLGYLLFRVGRLEEAEELYLKAIHVFEKLSAQDEKYLQNLSLVLNNIGVLYQRTGDYPRAEEWLKQSLQVRRKIAECDSTSALGFLAMSCLNYAKLLTVCEREAEAEDYYSQALELYGQLCLRDTKFKIDYSIGQYFWAEALEKSAPDRAIGLHREALVLREELFERNTEALKADVARSHCALGKLLRADAPAEAQMHLNRAQQLYGELYDKAPEKYEEEYKRLQSILSAAAE